MTRSRSATKALFAVLVVAGSVSALTSPVAAQSGVGDQYVLNDSPNYQFGGGTPLRNPPLMVAAMSAEKQGKAFTFNVKPVVSFVDGATPVTLRLNFYSRPGRPEVYGGVEMAFHTGSEPIEVTLVERASAGTATASEEWGDADEEFATVSGEYTDEGVEFTIKPKGSYRKLLRDPLTAVGYDLWTDAGNVQPSVRVSIGDLFGTKPGLLPLQGTAIAADGTPQPWITRPVSPELIKIGGQLSATVEGNQATFDAGPYADHASEFRLFISSPLEILPAGSRFPAYDLYLWGPDETSVIGRTGDAFLSTEAGTFNIVRDVDQFALELYTAYRNVTASAQAVVPGEEDAVLVATQYRVRF